MIEGGGRRVHSVNSARALYNLVCGRGSDTHAIRHERGNRVKEGRNLLACVNVNNVSQSLYTHTHICYTIHTHR